MGREEGVRDCELLASVKDCPAAGIWPVASPGMYCTPMVRRAAELRVCAMRNSAGWF